VTCGAHEVHDRQLDIVRLNQPKERVMFDLQQSIAVDTGLAQTKIKL
jgi:hypothetical protein